MLLVALQALLLGQADRAEVIRTKLEGTVLRIARKRVLTEYFRLLDETEKQISETYNASYFSTERSYLDALEKVRKHREGVSKLDNHELARLHPPKPEDFYG